VATTQVNLGPNEYATLSNYFGEENTNDHTSTSVTGSGATENRRQLLVKYYNAATSSYLYNQILSAKATVTYSGGNSGFDYLSKFHIGTLSKDLDFDKITYASNGFAHWSNAVKEPSATIYDFVNAVKYGVVFEPINYTTVTPITLSVNFGDYVLSTVNFDKINNKSASSSDTVINSTQDLLFTLTTGLTSKNVLKTPAITKIKLRYRPTSDDAYTEKDLGTDLTYTLSGSEIPSKSVELGEIQFQVACTSVTGDYESDWLTKTVATYAFKSVSPAAGSYVDRAAAALFSASLYSGCTLSAFKWRKSGATDATTVTLSGVTSYTLPANTITDGAEYEFTFTAVDQYGVEHELGEWITFTTADATPTASTISPSGTIVEADSSTVFRWSHTTATGTLPSKSELQYSADETTWTDLATVTGSATEYTLAAGTLTTGTWYWRVRTYNLDSVASEWSDAAQFIAVSKPSTPLITIADNSPRPTITWQVSEQEGYELTIDGETIRDYGTGKRWTSPRYLADGTHTVSIRVQNNYGLWSDTATMSFTVENTAGEAVYLSGTAENSATLNWAGVGYDFFIVYRNGKAIAKTENVTYCDRLYAGDAVYCVRGCYTDSYNYGISNETELEILPKNAVLEGIADGATIDLSLSDSQSRSFTWTQTRQSSSYHTAGRALPSCDIAEYLDQTLSGTCAIWKDDRADQRELESLLGQIVCLKTENGEFALGPLVSLTKAVGLFYVSYQLSVVNSYYEEEIALDS
jgi:hypothetical protein